MTTQSQANSFEARILPPRNRPREETARLARQFNDNLGYTLQLWDDLCREHQGEWIVVWGERESLIGEDVQELLDTLPDDVRRECLARFIAPVPHVV